MKGGGVVALTVGATSSICSSIGLAVESVGSESSTGRYRWEGVRVLLQIHATMKRPRIARCKGPIRLDMVRL